MTILRNKDLNLRSQPFSFALKTDRRCLAKLQDCIEIRVDYPKVRRSDYVISGGAFVALPAQRSSTNIIYRHIIQYGCSSISSTASAAQCGNSELSSPDLPCRRSLTLRKAGHIWSLVLWSGNMLGGMQCLWQVPKQVSKDVHLNIIRPPDLLTVWLPVLHTPSSFSSTPSCLG